MFSLLHFEWLLSTVTLCSRLFYLFQRFIWEHGIPVSFQQFKNYHLNQPTVFGFFIQNYDLEEHVCRTDKTVHKRKHCVCKKWDDLYDDVDTAKEKALNTLFPEYFNSPRCTMILLSNLAEPDWITVNC